MPSYTARDYLDEPVIPRPVYASGTRYPARPSTTAPMRSPTPQEPHPLLRRSPRLNFTQYPSFSLMQGSHVDGAPQNPERPQRPKTSHERPTTTSRPIPHTERSASRHGQLEQPMSRTHQLDRPETRPNFRPESRQQKLPESRQYQNPRPESRQAQYSQPENPPYPNLRPESRQHHHQGPGLETRHAPPSRPASRQDQYPRQEAAQGTAPPRPPSRSTRPPSRPPSRLDGADPDPQQSDRQNSRHNDAEGRAFRKGIADATIAAINRGLDGVDVRATQKYTKLYQDDDRDLANWARPPRSFFGPPTTIEINIALLSTLKGARFLAEGMKKRGKIGVLNFASATLPGGGFLTGARAQEESIARSSTLYVALTTPAARPFYATHAADDRRGFYTHSMIHSPDVHLFRDDDGAWLPPLAVDVVTSPAVNAGQVRRQGRSTPAKLEERIQDAMHERMGRILALFERKKVRNLVLGSFGTGVFQNDVRAMAAIWYELLQAPGARFAGSFDRVVFAIPDESTAKQFHAGFRGKTSRHE